MSVVDVFCKLLLINYIVFLFLLQGPKFTKVDVNLALSAYANARR